MVMNTANTTRDRDYTSIELRNNLLFVKADCGAGCGRGHSWSSYLAPPRLLTLGKLYTPAPSLGAGV